MGQAPVHLKFFGDGRKALGKFGQSKIELGGIELDSGQKKIGLFVSVLVGEQNVAVVTKDKVSDARDDAFTVGTGNEKDSGVMHRWQTSLCVPCVHCGSRL